MARRKQHEEHANHEAWAIPYADLMTLLLAFFVVMYAISSVNEGKYRVVAAALSTAFGSAPRTLNPVQVGSNQVKGGGWDAPSVINAGSRVGPSAPAPANDPSLLPAMASQMRSPVSFRDQEQLKQAERQLNAIADRLTATLAPLIHAGQVQKVGAARSQRYVLPRNVPGVGSEVRVMRIDTQGRPSPFARLVPLEGGMWDADARAELMDMFETKVHLFLFVKVREKWGDDPERYRDLAAYREETRHYEEVAALVTEMQRHQIPAVYAEPQFNARILELAANDAGRLSLDALLASRRAAAKAGAR